KRSCLEKQVGRLPFSMAFGSALKSRPEQSRLDVLQEAEKQMRNNKSGESKKARANLLKALYEQIEQKSCESVEHIKRLRNLSFSIGKKLNLHKTELSRLANLALLHDIGLVRLVENELLKTDNLTAQEWSKVKLHPREGWRIARATRDFANIAEDILSHHEWWDGSGYPRGLKGEEIPLLARIFAIADAYEVMTSGRPYKKALSRQEALREIKKCAGTQFAPDLVNIFVKEMMKCNELNQANLKSKNYRIPDVLK
ncbi:MAG: HD-GYP domain-containing protein, partial [Bacillota bacterium]